MHNAVLCVLFVGNIVEWKTRRRLLEKDKIRTKKLDTNEDNTIKKKY